MRPARSILRGDLGRVGLATLLTMLDMEKRGGILVLQRGKQLGRVFLRDGAVVRAQVETGKRESGVEAICQFLDWDRGIFELWQADVDLPDSMRTPTTFLLMEAARRRDEQSEPPRPEHVGEDALA